MAKKCVAMNSDAMEDIVNMSAGKEPVIVDKIKDATFECPVYRTSNYDMFHKLDGNRIISKIGRLKKSMKKHGFIMQPILVNERFEIAEGQHRFECAKELGLPIYFVVQNGIGLVETIDLNTGQKNWTPKDYIHSYAKTIPDYARLEQLCNMFPYDVYTISAALGYGLAGGNINSVLKQGVMSCTNEMYEKAIAILTWFNVFDETIKDNKLRGAKRFFYGALLYARCLDVVDVSVLTRRIKSNFGCFDGLVTSLEDAIEKVDKAYNYGVQKNNRVHIALQYKIDTVNNPTYRNR